MIQILDNATGNYFVTDDKTKVKIELNNPVFPDVNTSSRTMPFDLPAANSIFFGAPERGAVDTIKTSYDVTVILNNHPIKTGRLQYREALANGYHRVRVQLDDALVNRKIADVKLTDILPKTPISFSSGDLETNPYARFPKIKNEAFFGTNTVSSFQGYLNDDDQNHLCPQPIVQHLLSQVMQYSGFTVSGDFMNDAELANNLLLYSTHHVTPNSSVYWNRLLPDIKAGEFVELLKNMFCLAPIYRGNNVELAFRKDIINSSDYIDWSTHSFLPGQAFKDQSFTLQYDSKIPQQNFTVPGITTIWGNAQVGSVSKNQNITMAAPPLGYYTNNVYNITDNVVGSSNSLTDETLMPTNEIPLRMTLYRGKQNGYRAASSVAGSNYQYGLNIVGSKGLAEIFWQPWLDSLTQTVTRKGKTWLNVIDFANLNLMRKVRIAGRDYLIKKLSAVLTQAKIDRIECDLELVRISL